MTSPADRLTASQRAWRLVDALWREARDAETVESRADLFEAYNVARAKAQRLSRETAA